MPVPGFHLYSVSKAALDMYTKCIAQELGGLGVRVNGINPAAVRTNIFKSAGLDISQDAADKMYESASPMHILNRIGEPMEIAKVMSFLCSDSGSFITGINMPVDGGCLIQTPKFI